MRVNVDEIKSAGLARGWDMSREQVDEVVNDDPAGYRASAPAHVAARLEKLDRRVFLEVHTRAALTCPCGRCLAPTSVEVPVDFELTLVPAGEHPAAEEEREGRRGHRSEKRQARVVSSFDPERDDEDTYAGKAIDLDPIVREQ